MHIETVRSHNVLAGDSVAVNPRRLFQLRKPKRCQDVCDRTVSSASKYWQDYDKGPELRLRRSHKRPGNDDSPKIIQETPQYIRDFDRLAGTTTTARELYDKILDPDPKRLSPYGALWHSDHTVQPLY